MKSTNVRKMILIALFTALMVVGAFIRIPNPFFPVFFTFQGVFCAYAGLLLGAKAGSLSMLLYVLMGLAGLPVFSTPSGPQYVLQPTFGFLLGFIAASYVIGKISADKTRFTTGVAFIAALSGLIVMYLTGIGYMYMVYQVYQGKPVGFWALASSMSLYLVKDLILFVVVAITSVQIRNRLKIFLEDNA